MRLLIVILVLVVLVIVDQYKFHGYYGRHVSYFISRTVHAVAG